MPGAHACMVGAICCTWVTLHIRILTWLYLGDLCRSEVSAGEAAIAQLERGLAAAQAKLGQAESKLAAAQEDAAEKDKIIKYVLGLADTIWWCSERSSRHAGTSWGWCTACYGQLPACPCDLFCKKHQTVQVATARFHKSCKHMVNWVAFVCVCVCVLVLPWLPTSHTAQLPRFETSSAFWQ